MAISSKAKPSSVMNMASEAKATRNFTFACPPRPVSKCLAVTQALLPVEGVFMLVPDHPGAGIPCPPGALLISRLLNQLSGSLGAPTFCQVRPPSIEDCRTAPSMFSLVFHHIFIVSNGFTRLLKLKQGPITCEFSSWL